MRQRDDTGTVMHIARVLLTHLEPRELARRFVLQLAREFSADAALLRVDGAHDRPIVAPLHIDAPRTLRLAAWLRRRIDAGAACAWSGDAVPDGRGGWSAALAARSGAADGADVLVAVFAERSDTLRADTDGLLRAIAACTGTAFDRARRHAETARRADRSAIRAEQLARVRRRLERRVRSIETTIDARRRFLATASHELRTPINAILGYNRLLEQGLFGALHPRQAEIVGRISSSADQLMRLVNDVLDLSKLEAGRLDVERGTVDVHRLVADATALVEAQAGAKGLDLRVDCPPAPPHIETDAARAQRILANLLSNAVKFTDEGSVTVRVRHLAADGGHADADSPPSPPGADGWLAIAVEDTGAGIPAEQLDAVFDDFVQVATGTDRDAGTGLGLPISRRLARLLGGELYVESTLGERSIFTLYLPCPRDTGHDDARGR